MIPQLSQTQASNRDEKFSIMLASRNRGGLDQLVDIISRINGVEITTNHICNGHSDPLYGAEKLPQLLIFWIGNDWRDELNEMVKQPARQRIPMIVIGDTDEQEAMRLAMKAGAIDYMRPPFDALELQSSICDLIDGHEDVSPQQSGSITSVINAKGGAGGSLIACNIAHMMAEISHFKVSLVDLDIQFGSLCHYLDMDPKYGLLEALQNVYELDKHALEGYMLKHKSGLHLLDVKPGDLLLPEDICNENMDALLTVLSKNYDHVVVDLPRHIGMLSSVVLEQSEKVIVVLQQNISHLRDAKRLLEILENDIGIDNEKIRIVLNRHSKQADLAVEDISKALRHPVNLTIPNSFDQVSESINQGIPLYSVSQKSAITKAMMGVGDDLSGGSVIHEKTGFVGRIINNLKGV